MSIFRVVIPSRGRAESGTTFHIIPKALVFVLPEEYRAYRKAGIKKERLHKIPEDCTHSSKVRNYILDQFDEGDRILMMDDDIKKVGFFEADARKVISKKLTGKEFKEQIEQGFKLMKHPYKLFGVAPNTNSLNFRQSYTIGTFVNGPCMGIEVTDIRFDLKCNNKSDYDFMLQHWNKKYATFRLDYLWQDNDYNKMDGGTRSYRTKEKEIETYHYLLGKWPGLLTPNPRREYEFILKLSKKIKGIS